MGTIIDYLRENKDVTFEESEFNVVDSLVLCQLAYLKFDHIVPGIWESGTVTLMDIRAHPGYGGLFADERFEKDNRALFEAVYSCRRFSGLRLGNYINLIEQKFEAQFSAVTFMLGSSAAYIAFRGTDETIVGWKEDFNMAFLSPIPAQIYSEKYLKTVSSKFDGTLFVGGHSKGGNLAVYASMNCGASIRQRIKAVYNMDGPGFRPGVLKQYRYDRIRDKVIKIIPKSSLVGMVFEDNADYEVVDSNTFGAAQHNPFTWKCRGMDFDRVKLMREGARIIDEVLNEWILSLDEYEIKLFVDTFYGIICASQANDLIELTCDWKKSLNKMLAALKNVDPATAAAIKKIIRALFEKCIPGAFHKSRMKEA